MWVSVDKPLGLQCAKQPVRSRARQVSGLSGIGRGKPLGSSSCHEPEQMSGTCNSLGAGHGDWAVHNVDTTLNFHHMADFRCVLPARRRTMEVFVANLEGVIRD